MTKEEIIERHNARSGSSVKPKTGTHILKISVPRCFISLMMCLTRAFTAADSALQNLT
jgi:hypothetical protein